MSAHEHGAHDRADRPSDWIALPLPARAVQNPEGIALVTHDTTWTWAALSAKAHALAARFAALGAAPESAVAALLPNGAAFVALVHACAARNAVFVPLNTRLTPAELNGPLTDTAPGILVADRQYADVVDLLSLPAACHVLWSDGAGVVEPASPAEPRVPPANSATLPTGRESVPSASAQVIIHTSGSTGRPKGAILTWGNQAWSAAGSAIRLGTQPDDRWLAVMPLFHVGGLAILLRAAWSGAAVVVHDGFDAQAVWRSLQQDRIRLVSLVPTMLERLLDVADGAPPPDTLRAVLLGGGPMAMPLLARAVAAGWPIHPTYGLTEACSQVATAAPGWRPSDGLAVPPLPFTEIRIVDERGVPVPTGSEGVVEVRGPTVFAGYVAGESGTSIKGRDERQPWLHTGDHGQLDVRGRLSVIGRRTDLIVSGGENVDPVEVEDALRALPEIADACVFGMDDATWGQRVVGLLVAADGATLDAEAITQRLRGVLAGYKVPRALRETAELPRTATGKLQRRRAAALWDAGGDREGVNA